MRIIKQVLGFPFRFGGESHTGWLPLEAAHPMPMPVKKVMLNVYIYKDAENYVLGWNAIDSDEWDHTWFPTVGEAQTAAFEEFGIKESDWEEI